MNELFKLENKIYRVLKPGFEKILVVDCIKKSMPFYMNPIELDGYFKIDENDLLNELGVELRNYDDLSQKEKNNVNTKFGTISYVLSFIDEFHLLNEAIRKVAQMNNVCEATIRRRLCDYLTFQNIVVFLPNVTKKVKELSDDEKNFRWSLNKFYYNSLKVACMEQKEHICCICGKGLKVMATTPSHFQQ